MCILLHICIFFSSFPCFSRIFESYWIIALSISSSIFSIVVTLIYINRVIDYHIFHVSSAVESNKQHGLETNHFFVVRSGRPISRSAVNINVLQVFFPATPSIFILSKKQEVFKLNEQNKIMYFIANVIYNLKTFLINLFITMKRLNKKFALYHRFSI
jgi:hypothetical protein